MNIDLTDREMQLLIDCIGTNTETVRRQHDPLDTMVAELLTELADLDMDLREALHRQDDEWSDPEDPDLHMDPVDFAAKHDTDPSDLVICDAETHMFNAGVEARERMKATSRAAGRRALKFSPPGDGAKGDRPAPQPTDRSEMQDVDVWAKPCNDPADW